MIIAVDYASVDGNLSPDFRELQDACARLGSQAQIAIFRAAWGTTVDLTVHRDWGRAADAGMVCGAYLFLRMPRPNFTASPEDQVHVFADNMGPYPHRHLVPTIDVEDTGLSPAAELAWVHRAWREMKSIYGVPPMIYDSDRVWAEDLANLPAGEMIDSPQWVAKPWPWRMRTTPQLSAKPFVSGKWDPTVPSPWGAGNWWLHQYQGDAFPVPGFLSTVDLSRFQVMHVGERSPRVTWMRRRLGAPGPAVYDQALATLVMHFQRASGLVADAVIGPHTFAALSWSAVDAHPLVA